MFEYEIYFHRINTVKESTEIYYKYSNNINCSDQASEILRKIIQEYGQNDREHFIVLLLDAQLKINGFNIVSVGSVNAAMVDIRSVLKPIILSNASAIIIGHNHPSGSLKPSNEDDQVTIRISDLCKLISVQLCDHIIVTEEQYYSYKENGKLNSKS
ncbi:MAG: JAB domain-containing protein [Desulfobacterales bacterium]|nr:JAB domain-containing protein [Desulfobacterales bacterium]